MVGHSSCALKKSSTVPDLAEGCFDQLVSQSAYDNSNSKELNLRLYSSFQLNSNEQCTITSE